MPAILYGLGAALGWGSADFFGGLQSRKVPALSVVLWSQVVGAALNVTAILVVAPHPQFTGVLWGVAGGMIGGLGLLLFYRALALGTMSIVAPISATGAIIPVIVSFARGDAPTLVATIGIVVAIVGVVLVVRPRRERPALEEIEARIENAPDSPAGHTAVAALASRNERRAVLMAFGAAFLMAQFVVLSNEGFKSPGSSPLWVVSGGRAGTLLALLVLLGASRLTAPWPGSRLGAVAAVGVTDAAASICIAYALTRGNLGVVAVLAAQFPVVTVLLARAILGERLTGNQAFGVAFALVGIGLLAAG